MFFARLCHAIAMHWLTRLLPMPSDVMKAITWQNLFPDWLKATAQIDIAGG
jgi:hypothetical protein